MRRTTRSSPASAHVAAAMVPTRNLLHHEGNSSSKSYYHPGQYCVGIATQLETSAAAARRGRKQPRSPPVTSDADELAAPGTSFRGGAGAGHDGDWLQLGLATASSSSASYSGDNHSTAPAPPCPMELDLFTCDDKGNTKVKPPLFPLPLRSYSRGRCRKTAASGPMSSAPFLPFMPPFRSSGDAMRVISPPRRTEAAGLWLTLQAASNQAKEPILPQIPKSYLRIKDSNIKVEVVMKYLADKLGLTRSHQVELTCRGQILPSFFVMKYVRDCIWCSPALREEQATLADLPRRRSPAANTTDHVMTLCYSTSRNL